jgi:hypothetical protein
MFLLQQAHKVVVVLVVVLKTTDQVLLDRLVVMVKLNIDL